MMKQNKKWADILIAFIKAERSLMILYICLTSWCSVSSIYIGTIATLFFAIRYRAFFVFRQLFFRISIFEVLQAVSITGTPG